MASSVPSEAPRPFVATSIARHLMARLQATHDERAITVISGPWGIGKTTAIDAFQAENECSCAIVKVDPGSSKVGALPIAIMQLAIEAIYALHERREEVNTNYSLHKLNRILHDQLKSLFDEEEGYMPTFTFIFDEAQYLSPKAIEMLRYWNDQDRGKMPFPVGLFFIGNNEFALRDSNAGESVLSGAVQSRALFIESLDHAHLSDLDLTLFLQSREISDAAAIQAVLAHFSDGRVKRDLRRVEGLVNFFRRRAGGNPVTHSVVQSVLNL